MNNQSFSKIWIIVIIGVFVAGGILAWQYWDWIEFQLRPGIPMQETSPYIPKSCSKNEDCGRDICQQGRDKCVEIKYICENGTCIFPAKTIEFPSSPYKCIRSKCEKEVIEDETANWKTYRNEKYGFEEYGLELKYPADWVPRDITFGISKEIAGEDASIDIETMEWDDIRYLTPLEKMVDKVASQMGKVIHPKKEIYVGGEKGYEIIGTLCTEICTGSPEDVFTPFAMIYLFHNDKIYKISYVEGITGVGWKNNIENWKYYNEFLKILSTFRFWE